MKKKEIYFEVKDEVDLKVLGDLNIPPKRISLGDQKYIHQDELDCRLKCMIINITLSTTIVILGGLILTAEILRTFVW